MTDIQAINAGDGSAPEGSKSRTLILALVAAGAVGALLFSFANDGVGHIESPSTRPTEQDLFGTVTGCHAKPGEAPAERARTSEQAAFAKKERAPFEPSDGIEAVGLLSEAAACLENAGVAARSQALRMQAVEWRTEIWRSFQAHLLRSELARENGQPEEELSELRALKALWGKNGGAFGERLRVLEVDTEAKLSKSSKK
ncbi:MAG: hypothetical protein SFV15_04930 [Polyangiaceae bacterium]|nr:hypothetical protein [Polyangiaceae bacterium]